jgi:hypothetical protein
VHAKVQREIKEHDETSSEAEPSNRHLVAENPGIWHLNVVTPTSRLGIVPTRIDILEGSGSESEAADVRFGSKTDIEVG